ncbi:MAG TPA: glutamate--tRNA ligase, partial [Acidimicrobiales bacterium]|nr:glutamate--tRNA ligase [Acidimicrobiales bacterium]
MSDTINLYRRGVNTSTPPRVRFAPSPTGYFHVGGARTALYNWLVARQGNGDFILRIEDTDRERSEAGWIDGILSALEWLGISWDEGPYLQSERGEIYAAVARQLFESGHAYACDCSREAVEERTKNNPIPGYDGFCRDRRLEPGPGRALRFRVPDEGVTVVHDVVRGDVEFQNSTIEDFVIVKSNGDPLFVLAVVADDRDMRITHVMRAEEHLPTTPKAVLIWEALGGPPLPVFAHLPVLVNEKRQKLSKRRDRVAVEDYRDQGYLPEAMRNYLVLLGWGPPDQREILTVEEMIDEFRLEDVNVSPAFFDERRLAHFNAVYIRALPVEEFVSRALAYLDTVEVPWPSDRFDKEAFVRLAPLIQERITTLAEIVPLVEFLFADPFLVDQGAFTKAIRGDADAVSILEQTRD